jgi:hypothetical protein
VVPFIHIRSNLQPHAGAKVTKIFSGHQQGKSRIRNDISENCRHQYQVTFRTKASRHIKACFKTWLRTRRALNLSVVSRSGRRHPALCVNSAVAIRAVDILNALLVIAVVRARVVTFLLLFLSSSRQLLDLDIVFFVPQLSQLTVQNHLVILHPLLHVICNYLRLECDSPLFYQLFHETKISYMFTRLLEGKRSLERPRRIWENGLRMDLREIGWGSVKWIQLAQDWGRWRALVNTVMNLRVLAPRS